MHTIDLAIGTGTRYCATLSNTKLPPKIAVIFLWSIILTISKTSAWSIMEMWPFNTKNLLSRTSYVVLPRQSLRYEPDVFGPPRGTATPATVVSKTSYEWVAANSRKWYSAQEQCILDHHQYNQTYSYYKIARICNHSVDNTRGIVSVGMTTVIAYGGGEKCKQPMDSNHPYYKKAMKWYQNYRAPGLVETAKAMRENKICMLFLGDSLTRQFYYGYLSELQRLDGNITVHKYRNQADVPAGMFPNTFSAKSNKDNSVDRSGGLSQVFFDKERKEQSIVWYEHLSRNSELSRVIEVIDDLRKASCKGITVIANTGLHYNTREEYDSEIPQLLSFLEELAKKPYNTVFWRETTAQHFPGNPEGLYDHANTDLYTAARCAAHTSNTTNEINWRNEDTIKHWRRLKLQNVVYIPFYQYTKPLWSMHEDPKPGEHTDCTHYCWWPMLGQPVWFTLSRTMLAFFNQTEVV